MNELVLLLHLMQVAPPVERVPTDIRRTTIIVENMDRSLELYRDVLGLKVNYDAVVTMSGVALPAGKPGAKARLVLLNSNDGFIGWIGLLEWTSPRLAKQKKQRTRLGIGDIVIVTNTDDADKRCGMAKSVKGVRFTGEPHTTQYPGRNGGPPIRVRGCNFFDPDGTLLELNQILK
jgi:catechol 2,3-dioxygenase-like lactoylglutathione lyase family enzyme